MVKISQNTKAGSAAPHSAHTINLAPLMISIEMIKIIIYIMVEYIAFISSLRFDMKLIAMAEIHFSLKPEVGAM